jgi:hypothetical protein
MFYLLEKYLKPEISYSSVRWKKSCYCPAGWPIFMYRV